ncbi:MAG: UxaA family hydrolase, partial [Pyramidobacter sp.]|nr:UxaA family hydrolase [Pyramidobacter sp.]
MTLTFNGYRRSDGTVGVRNHLAVIPSVFCANKTAEKIAAQLPGAVALRHAVGCSQVGLDLELTARTLKAMGTHPNVGAVIIVGLGCERFPPRELEAAVKKSGRPAACFIIQEEGGVSNTVTHAVEAGRELQKQLDVMERVPCPLSDLMVGTKCGGTDATSGLAANPAVGEMADLLTAQGGSAILSELNELLGTEHILARRAVSKQVADKVYSAIYEIEDVLRSGLDMSLGAKRNQLISPGNADGGVSSIVEKALGGVHKSGTSPLVDVIDYATPPEKGAHGLFLMKYESHDGEVVTGMVGCGAQIVAFTTGRGTPAGHPLAPVIK